MSVFRVGSTDWILENRTAERNALQEVVDRLTSENAALKTEIHEWEESDKAGPVFTEIIADLQRENKALREALVAAEEAMVDRIAQDLEEKIFRRPKHAANYIRRKFLIKQGRSCTCHPSEAPKPCQRRYALSECQALATSEPK